MSHKTLEDSINSFASACWKSIAKTAGPYIIGIAMATSACGRSPADDQISQSVPEQPQCAIPVNMPECGRNLYIATQGTCQIPPAYFTALAKRPDAFEQRFTAICYALNAQKLRGERPTLPSQD